MRGLKLGLHQLLRKATWDSISNLVLVGLRPCGAPHSPHEKLYLRPSTSLAPLFPEELPSVGFFREITDRKPVAEDSGG